VLHGDNALTGSLLYGCYEDRARKIGASVRKLYRWLRMILCVEVGQLERCFELERKARQEKFERRRSRLVDERRWRRYSRDPEVTRETLK